MKISERMLSLVVCFATPRDHLSNQIFLLVTLRDGRNPFLLLDQLSCPTMVMRLTLQAKSSSLQ